MPVRVGEEILGQFDRRLSKADAVDIAVAWATHCPAVEKLRAFCNRGGKLRIVVGVDGNATNPTTLKDLQGFARLRIGKRPGGGIFHPKYYCFRRSGSSTVWIGSANLTNGGFGGNTELVAETKGGEGSMKWFEALWDSLAVDPNEEIAAYENSWRPRIENTHRQSPTGKSNGSRRRGAQERLDDSWSWDDFVSNLHARDEAMRIRVANDRSQEEEPWSGVFGEHGSWMHTIRVGGPITRLPSWAKLERWQVEVLVGQTPWGALGTLRGAGTACSMIAGASAAARSVRRDILQHLKSTIWGGGDLIQTGVKALSEITSHHGIGSGVATRFLSLARPDCYLSVNGASREKLAAFSGLPQSTLDRRYEKLLEWVHGSKWHNAPRPSGSLEGEIWDYRAALVDAFAYDVPWRF